MRRSTALMSQWKTDTKTGESLTFELCKGGYFSRKDEYGLKVVGRTAQETLSGKNLFDINNPWLLKKDTWDGSYAPKIENGILYNGGVLGENSGQLLSFENEGTNTYTLSFDRTQGDILYIYIYEFDEYAGDIATSPAYVYSTDSATLTSVTFNVSKNYFGICLFSAEKYGVGLADFQVELGETPTIYEPYCGGALSPNPDYPMPIKCIKQGSKIICGNEITIPCDLYEGDIYYPAVGKIKRYSRAIVFTGTETIESGWWTNMLAVMVGAPDYNNKTPYCKEFFGINSLPDNPEERINKIYLHSAAVGVGYPGTAAELKALFKQRYDAGNPIKVVYFSDVPIIEQYTPQPIYALPGMVNVTQVPTDLPAELSATMLVRNVRGVV